MTKLELTKAVVDLAMLGSYATESKVIERMMKATKEVCISRYAKVLAEKNRVQAAKYVVMCATGIEPKGIIKDCRLW